MLRKQFTLLEILIATVVMAIGMLGILAIFPESIRVQRRSEDITSGALIAKTVMASIQLAARESGISSNHPFDTNDENWSQINDSNYYYDYRLTAVTSAPYNEGTTNNLLYQLTIRVYVLEGLDSGPAVADDYTLIDEYFAWVSDKTE